MPFLDRIVHGSYTILIDGDNEETWYEGIKTILELAWFRTVGDRHRTYFKYKRYKGAIADGRDPRNKRKNKLYIKEKYITSLNLSIYLFYNYNDKKIRVEPIHQ